MIIKNTQDYFSLTYYFLICSVYSIISIFFIFYKLFSILCISSLIFLIATTYFYNYKITIACLLSVFIIFFRFYQKEKNFNLHSDYLNKEIIISGKIEKIEHNLQDKKSTLLFITTDYLYHKELGTNNSSKCILLQIPYFKSKNLEIGQTLKFFRIKLQQPENESSYKTYLMKENIWATAYLNSEKFYILKPSIKTWYQNYFLKLSNYFQKECNNLYNAIFLGNRYKDKLSLNIKHQSLYWGISHHMARSGIHLVAILQLFIIIFHYLAIFQRWRFLVYSALIITYACISIPSVSFTRAFLMILFQMFAKAHGFLYSGIHAFLLTTLIVIFHNPFNVFFLDFQLSFGITGIIIWLFYIKNK